MKMNRKQLVASKAKISILLLRNDLDSAERREIEKCKETIELYLREKTVIKKDRRRKRSTSFSSLTRHDDSTTTTTIKNKHSISRETSFRRKSVRRRSSLGATSKLSATPPPRLTATPPALPSTTTVSSSTQSDTDPLPQKEPLISDLPIDQNIIDEQDTESRSEEIIESPLVLGESSEPVSTLPEESPPQPIVIDPKLLKPIEKDNATSNQCLNNSLVLLEVGHLIHDIQVESQNKSLSATERDIGKTVTDDSKFKEQEKCLDFVPLELCVADNDKELDVAVKKIATPEDIAATVIQARIRGVLTRVATYPLLKERFYSLLDHYQRIIDFSPDTWLKCHDDSTNRTYYRHRHSSVAVWLRPHEVVSQCFTNEKVAYYYNHLSGVSTWHDPRLFTELQFTIGSITYCPNQIYNSSDINSVERPEFWIGKILERLVIPSTGAVEYKCQWLRETYLFSNFFQLTENVYQVPESELKSIPYMFKTEATDVETYEWPVDFTMVHD